MHIFTLLQLHSPGAPAGFWPITATGWITIFLAVMTVVGGFIAWGKMLEKLNGYGGRLKVVEDDRKVQAGEHSVLQKQIDSMLQQHAVILERLGHATKAASDCNLSTDVMGDRIEKKLEDVSGKIEKMNVGFSERLTRVETTISNRAGDVRRTSP